MKKHQKFALFPLCFALLLAACDRRIPDASETSSELSSSTASVADTSFENSATEASTIDSIIDNTPIDPEVQKYFEYFENNAEDICVISRGRTKKDIAARRAAYILMKLYAEASAKHEESNYVFSKEEFDRAALEYLGEPITQYETRMSTVTPEGNVTATGWGMIGCDFMVLTELEKLGDNHYKGSFDAYSDPYPYGDPPEESYDDCCQRMMRKIILPTDYLVGTFTLEWTEWESEVLGLQLRYISTQFTGAPKTEE